MKRLGSVSLGLGVLLVVSVGVSVSFGHSVAFADVLSVLLHHLSFGATAPPDPTADRIVWYLMMPRTVLAMLVGGGLAIVGVAMQALVRNPLAEPYILGLSSGASAGASLFYLGFLPPILSATFSMPLAAFLGGLISMTLVYLVARQGRTLPVAQLLLAGVAMSALMGALTSFITFLSPDPNKLRAVLFWLLGSLGDALWERLLFPGVACGIGLLVLLVLARPMDALLLGEEPAYNLGVPVEAVKRILILVAALVTGALVASAGAIGFVGLIVPHAVRALVGVPHRRVLLVSYFAGSVFLLWADLATRMLMPNQDLPVGIVTALTGVPFFLVLLRRQAYRFGS